jgi:prepilin-type N-terminal cleavage/methylation domain-containing protein
MKPAIFKNSRRGRGFTLAEVLMAVTILVFVFAAIISVNLWGLAMNQRSQIWLNTSDDTRHSMEMLHEDVRTASTIYVGTGSLAGFTNVGATNVQAGNALLLYASTNTNSWVLYYYDSTTNTLFRTNWDGTAVGDFKMVSANPITNDNYIFTMQDYLGNILTNATPYPVVAIYLSFTKLQNPQIVIEPGSPVDFYQINTKIAPRMRP